MFSVASGTPMRMQTPVSGADNGIVSLVPEASTDAEEEGRRAAMAELYRKSEARVALLFADDGTYDYEAIHSLMRPSRVAGHLPPPTTDHTPIREPPLKKARRAINEDDYDDDDEEEDGELASKPAGDRSHADAAPGEAGAGAGAGPGINGAVPRQLLSPSKSGSSPVHSVGSPEKHGAAVASQLSQSQSHLQSQAQSQSQPSFPNGTAKTSEDARKELEEARSATEEAARRNFHTLFYTLENDRTAMLEQQQLEESEKQIQAEMDKTGAVSANGTAGNGHGSGGGHGSHGGSGGGHGSGSSPAGQGTLSSANLGASSLTLKHLIARIDMKRGQVKATDAELRALINEVRKNRSKWASEDNVGQEELYEALEKVLSELKAHTEYSTPFLQRVNKREAPDYHNYVKQPMDLGTMTKKLKGLQYKAKAEFVADLNLVWDNCFKYNRDASHPLRRKASGMRKEAEKLIPLIPDLTIRSRAEVEAEERRKQNGGDDGGDDDSDDEPIMSSRGRKTGAKGVSNKSRSSAATTAHTTAPATADQQLKEATPGLDQKPVLPLNGLLARPGREGSEAAGGDGGSTTGFGTPLLSALGGAGGGGGGSVTPGGINGHHSDAMDMDGDGLALDRALTEAAEQAYEDEEYKIWKQATKKDRALLAKRRYDLFRDNRLNVEAPALLRNKAGMRRYLQGIKQAEAGGRGGASKDSAAKSADLTLAEGMEDEVEKVIPDYYEPETIVPGIPSRLQWVEGDDGQVIDQNAEFLRLLPAGLFVSPPSRLAKRFDANMRQMQETRKTCAKIGVVKQMQVQTQLYQNQFQRYDPEPFHEADIEPHFVSGDGPFMAKETCRAALQRSVAKIFFHAGFEELQPSAMEAMTDIAADYFTKVCHTFNVYHEAERKAASGRWAERGARFQPRYSPEEVVLHTLYENGHDLASLDAYACDDLERLGSKLASMHDRMKTHLGDLLRPALQEGGGSEAFHDGSEQFVGGDFAEELGEDFFGFKALGLDKELGLDILSVPLHLLQSRVRSQHAVDEPAGGSAHDTLFEPLPPLAPVTTANIADEIGLVKNFFLAKLHANGDQPLVEDEDLPVKQRRPRPRLGATGKIVSPQKRPPKEQIAMAKRKKREAAAAALAAAAAAAAGAAAPEKASPTKKLQTGSIPSLPPPSTTSAPLSAGSSIQARPGGGPLANGTSFAPADTGSVDMDRAESTQSQGGTSQADDKDEPGGLMSPESIER